MSEIYRMVGEELRKGPVGERNHTVKVAEGVQEGREKGVLAPFEILAGRAIVERKIVVRPSSPST